MNITDVRVRKIAKEGKMKAVVSITIDDEFVVHDIKVIEGEKGLFIAMPSRKASDGEYRDIRTSDQFADKRPYPVSDPGEISGTSEYGRRRGTGGSCGGITGASCTSLLGEIPAGCFFVQN